MRYRRRKKAGAEVDPVKEMRSRWPLPLSLVLAVLLWKTLNDRVRQTQNVDVPIRVQAGGAAALPRAERGLTLRLPETETPYEAVGFFDAFDKRLQDRQVRFTFVGPGRFVRSDLQNQVTLYAELDPGERESKEFTATVKLEDIRTDPAELQPFLDSMEPAAIKVKFVASGQHSFKPDPATVQLELPEPVSSWEKRIFKDSMRFEPDRVILRGPANLLEEAKAARTLFKVDCREAPAELEKKDFNASSQSRPRLEFELKLLDRFKTLQMAVDVKVSIEVAPDPPRFPLGDETQTWQVPVRADWQASELEPKDFVVDEHVKIQIYSYDSRLTELLKQRGESWVRRNLRATVDMGVVDQDFRNAADPLQFYKALEPHFACYDDQFRIGRDLRVHVRGLVQVKRRQ
ncbi:MAG: hypothetical protein R3F30_13095 [Planctomycetota bacterium]